MNAKSKTRFAAAVVMLLGAFLSQCTKKPTSPNINAGRDFPSQPIGLTVLTGDRQIELSWAIDNPGNVRSYRVYRRDTTTAQFFFLDSTLTRNYLDRLVRNGVSYSYQVSAVSRSGVEGLRSSAISGTPNVYALRIAAGAEYIANASVLLSITAPLTTEFMLIGNDTSFANSSWQGFEREILWTLTPGDGLKNVYAKFRDSDGNETRILVNDSIILDTIALIDDLVEDTNGLPQQANDLVHFTLTANEPNGQAFVSIEGGPQNIKLFDNGALGDQRANDGVYELDYRIPVDVEVARANVIGRFTDRVGNVAATVVANGKITIQKPPRSVRLDSPTPTGTQQNALRLTWAASTEADFANYSIYRSTSSGFTPQAGLLLDRVTSQGTTFYNDNTVQPGITYYYQLVVYDKDGLKSEPSNEVFGRLSNNLPPGPVVLSTPILLGDGTREAQLTWSRSGDADFASYRLYRANSLQVDSLSTLVISIPDINTTVYADRSLNANTTYYYRVYVYDQAGKSAGSNVVSIRTAPNQPPRPVTLAVPTALDTSSVSLSWSQNLDADFASYRIYRSKTPGIIGNQPPVRIINLSNSTTFIDVGLERNTTYYYRVFVYDTGELSSGSNEVTITTKR